MEELAEIWKAWSVYERPIKQAVTWADVKGNIMVEVATALATASSRKIFQTTLTLMEHDIRMQRTFFRTFEFDSFGSMQ